MSGGAAVRDQEPLEFSGRQGGRNPVALGQVTTHGAKKGQLLVGLDAFGHYGETERMRKLDDALDDGVVLRPPADFLHEGGIDLDTFERKLLQAKYSSRFSKRQAASLA